MPSIHKKVASHFVVPHGMSPLSFGLLWEVNFFEVFSCHSSLIQYSSNSLYICASLWDRANVFGNSEEVASDTVTTGTPLSEPPLIDMMSNDPVLRGVKVLLLYIYISIFSTNFLMDF